MMPESVVANFVKATRQDVQQKTAKELHAVDPARANLARIVILVAERYMRFSHRNQARVGDRDAKHIARKVLHHRVFLLAVRFDEAVP